jgi:hypothetical protein
LAGKFIKNPIDMQKVIAEKSLPMLKRIW